MFSFSSITESKDGFKGTIRMKKFPTGGLGNYKDVDGKVWNINAIINGYVCACPVDELSPYWSSTASIPSGLYSQRWDPYKVEVVGEEK